jgi:Flp pilus assembly protein TadG
MAKPAHTSTRALAADPEPAVGGDEPVRRCRGQQGVVLVIFGLMLLVLLAFAGFAVDLGHWYYEANREQKAADAAALAAVVFLPGDTATAGTTALNTAKYNGYDSTGGCTATLCVTATQLGTSRMKVSVTEQVKNFFISAIGLKTQQITRSAVADYAAPLAMGSPANTFGNEPAFNGADTRLSTIYTSSTQPNFWANVFGPQSAKQSGDALQAQWCDTATPDKCSAFTRGPGVNQDYSNYGYFYKVSVSSVVSPGKLAIEVFDPAFVDVGDLCDGDPGNHGGNSDLTGATSSTNPFTTTGAEASARYAAGQTAYCTGDQLFTGGNGDGNPPRTTFAVRGPVGTSPNPLDAPVLAPDGTSCSPQDTTNFPKNQFPGYSVDNLANALKSSSGSYDSHIAEVFHRWYRICTVNVSVPGDYLIQVRTNVGTGVADPANDPGNPSLAGGGANRFALRAAWLTNGGAYDTSTTDNGTITIQGNAAMGLYANVPAGVNTKFYFARVPPSAAGRTLDVNLFDIGDCSGTGCAPTLKVLDKTGAVFASCTESIGPGAPTTYNAAGVGCSFTAGSAFNARWVTLQVPISNGYTCTLSVSTDCWVQIQYSPPAGSLTDTTTWTANIEGDPVRLVQ